MQLVDQMAAAIGTTVAQRPAARVRGGCINECFRWESGAGPLFVKLADAASLPLFAAEAAGLAELAQADAVRVPRVLAVGATGESAFLVLEWIELGVLTGDAQALLGEHLALMHRRTVGRFGWDLDNTIGSTPQINSWSDDWLGFFRDQRLGFQLELAHRNGHGGRLQQRGADLLRNLHRFLADHAPQPSLLHGDLWGGNAGAAPDGTPVIFDPAVYYGDRETDLAMTRLFGGFGSRFHAAYGAAWPLPPGAAGRVELYNLYHVLNHLNLFGGGYSDRAMNLIDSLLARIGR